MKSVNHATRKKILQNDYNFLRDSSMFQFVIVECFFLYLIFLILFLFFVQLKRRATHTYIQLDIVSFWNRHTHYTHDFGLSRLSFRLSVIFFFLFLENIHSILFVLLRISLFLCINVNATCCKCQTFSMSTNNIIKIE